MQFFFNTIKLKIWQYPWARRLQILPALYLKSDSFSWINVNQLLFASGCFPETGMVVFDNLSGVILICWGKDLLTFWFCCTHLLTLSQSEFQHHCQEEFYWPFIYLDLLLNTNHLLKRKSISITLLVFHCILLQRRILLYLYFLFILLSETFLPG